MENKDRNQGNSTNRTNEEEIDLGQLFTLIGKGFSNLFSFFGNIIKWIFNVFMSFILFIRKNFVKISIGAVLGATLGGIYQYGFKTPTYESSMTIQPNFGSTVQIYKNLDYYHNLVLQDDVARLSESLSLTEEEAKSIVSIEVEPYVTQAETLLSYEKVIAGLDSVTVSKIDFEEFMEQQTFDSYRYHVITVRSEDKYVFQKLRKPIISSVVKNPYYDNVKKDGLANLSYLKKTYSKSLIELDSLSELYKKVMLTESNRENSGAKTNIFMAESEDNSYKEIMLFDKKLAVNEEILNVNRQLTYQNEVINVVSSFNSIGTKVGGWYRNFMVLGFVVGFLFVLITVSLFGINRKLSAFEEKLNK